MPRSVLRKIILIGGALSGAAMLVSPAAACGTRHVYNHSADPWTIEFVSSKATCSIGSVHNATSCTVPPGQTAELHYPDPGNGSIAIKSGHRGSSTLTFAINSKCLLEHSGRTPNFFLNDPANGDVNTCGPRNYGPYTKD